MTDEEVAEEMEQEQQEGEERAPPKRNVLSRIWDNKAVFAIVTAAIAGLLVYGITLIAKCSGCDKSPPTTVVVKDFGPKPEVKKGRCYPIKHRLMWSNKITYQFHNPSKKESRRIIVLAAKGKHEIKCKIVKTLQADTGQEKSEKPSECRISAKMGPKGTFTVEAVVSASSNLCEQGIKICDVRILKP